MRELREGVTVYNSELKRIDIRFGFNSFYGGLHCGECLQVMNDDGEWINTRIEMGDDWYFVGFPRISLVGLCVRI